MSTLPFEFTVEGPPLSHQTRDRSKLESWRNQVKAAATAWTTEPVRKPLRFRVTYFHEGDSIVFDNDNLVKPIQDALNGLIYVDDRQLTHIDVVKVSINERFRVRGTSMKLLQAFSTGKVFIHVSVDYAPDSADVLNRP